MNTTEKNYELIANFILILVIVCAGFFIVISWKNATIETEKQERDWQIEVRNKAIKDQYLDLIALDDEKLAAGVAYVDYYNNGNFIDKALESIKTDKKTVDKNKNPGDDWSPSSGTTRKDEGPKSSGGYAPSSMPTPPSDHGVNRTEQNLEEFIKLLKKDPKLHEQAIIYVAKALPGSSYKIVYATIDNYRSDEPTKPDYDYAPVDPD